MYLINQQYDKCTLLNNYENGPVFGQFTNKLIISHSIHIAATETYHNTMTFKSGLSDFGNILICSILKLDSTIFITHTIRTF